MSVTASKSTWLRTMNEFEIKVIPNSTAAGDYRDRFCIYIFIVVVAGIVRN